MIFKEVENERLYQVSAFPQGIHVDTGQSFSDLLRFMLNFRNLPLQKKQIRGAKCSQVKQSVIYCNEDVRVFIKQLAETLAIRLL